MSEPVSTSEWLAAVWRELLGTTSVTLDSDFYDLGGHSVFALQMLSRVADEFSVVVGVEDLFTFRTLGALSQRIDGLRSELAVKPGTS
jgi:acyl carrier protein